MTLETEAIPAHELLPPAGVRPAPDRARVLVVASVFPSAVQPIHGVFVKERVRAVASLPEFDVRVLSPVPYFPPIRSFKRWYPLSQIPREEQVDGLSVFRPRYFLPPKLGAYFHPQLMHLGAARAVRRLRRTFDFDVIDAHFIYPDGVVAARLAQEFGKPLVLTGRGEDILRFPDKPVIGPQVRWALSRATRLVALSREIADAMVRNGANADRVTVIPNGVDLKRFHPVPRDEARARLGLPLDRPIVVSVGYRLELKGFHLLIDAIPRIREAIPNVLVVIVGGQARWGNDYTSVIEERIRTNNVADFVHLAGARPPEELLHWYSAADLFTLLTSREGSPNVLMEALACGLPAVATSVGGIPDVLRDERLGLLLPERSAEAAARGVVEGLQRTWDRAGIRRIAESRSWGHAALQVRDVLRAALHDDHGRRGDLK